MGTDADVPVITLRGERVALGPMHAGLRPLLARWFNDLGTTRSLGDIQPPQADPRVDAWYRAEWETPDLIPFAIYALPELRPIGTTALLGVDRRHATAEFGIIIGEPSARGRGYGGEVTRLMVAYAFGPLGLHSLLLTVYAFNVAGIRAYERAGFRVIGTRRQCYQLAGHLWDKVYMEVVR